MISYGITWYRPRLHHEPIAAEPLAQRGRHEILVAARLGRHNIRRVERVAAAAAATAAAAAALGPSAVVTSQ